MFFFLGKKKNQKEPKKETIFRIASFLYFLSFSFWAPFSLLLKRKRCILKHIFQREADGPQLLLVRGRGAVQPAGPLFKLSDNTKTFNEFLKGVSFSLNQVKSHVFITPKCYI